MHRDEQDAQLVLHTDSRLFDWPLDGLFDLGKSMNREDIIRMAREADFKANVNEPYNVTNEWVFRFAALVASAEREACAKVCESIGQHNIINQCANAIQARDKHD